VDPGVTGRGVHDDRSGRRIAGRHCHGLPG
jgi:hypothetical protein